MDDSSKLAGGRYFIGTPTREERIQLVSVGSSTQIMVTRAFEVSINVNPKKKARHMLAGSRIFQNQDWCLMS